jgi:hypothetical protein
MITYGYIDSIAGYKKALGILLVDLEIAHNRIDNEMNNDMPNAEIIRSAQQHVSISMELFNKTNTVKQL